MAGVAAAYSSDALASPTVDGSQWEFAVPLGHEESRHARPRNSQDSNSVRAKSSRKRHSNGSRSSSVSRAVHAHDSPYLTSNRGRRDPSLNRRGSEVGSMRDAYGYDGSRREPEEGKDGLNLILDGTTSQEQWIHRDKLAKIESEELHQAAILFQRRMRGESKSSGRERSLDSQGAANGTGPTSPTEYSEPWPELREESRRGVNGTTDRQHWDLRRPEEIAADDAAASLYSHPSQGKSASRIPISTASPVPLAGTGRDSRGPRSRAATDEDDRSSRGRRASEPINIDQDGSTPPSSSRPGSRGFTTTQNTPAKKKPAGSTNRKTSAPPTNRKTSAPRSRAVSGNARPTTRGNETRPTTAANRPEGDPPWLATMYKPDPRLPPDQQMLPTLAKKMQQEQWEKEGRTPNTYDRNFAPLAVHPFDAPPVPSKTSSDPVPEPEPEPQPQSQQPVDCIQLDDMRQPAKSPEPPRPNTSTGYSTMPKVQDTPPMGLTPNPNPNWTPPVVTAREQPKKEKSCGCCIVM
ncbi:unnamed protein product [Penicillium salamii]|uniref:TeaA receptor TeaR n=1 Tax=Penicillium salamii TaxID=1612424 RepID=A0A9W4J568_9EURO|nr:unnamed protein product [Penicillium salamii]CAG8189597.1 unnamed protein product [Penicillium salamii]CAG8261342.1 unnamed protein product [Penicillium salamii]CAG8314399.1 unnamed protein product [Penicillium salamii]CAG8370440.1 unnamed protein product [Penicillium salamii]